MNDLICDSSGVPELIQHIRYMSGDMRFYATFYDGSWGAFNSDDVCPSVGLMAGNVSRMQMLEAENAINKIMASAWSGSNGRRHAPPKLTIV